MVDAESFAHIEGDIQDSRFMTIPTERFKDEYPFQSYFLDLDGVNYHFLDEGEGSPILMLHGNPTWSFYYRKLVLGLRDAYRCIVPDHIGCGLSDKPQDYPYTLEQHISNVRRLVETLRLTNLTLVVHDWGGPIGMGLALHCPERIKRFVIFNTSAFLSHLIPFRISICRIPGLGALAIRGCNAFAGAAVHMACADKKRMTPAVKAGYLAPYNNWANRIATHRFVQDIPMSSDHPTYPLMRSIDAGVDRFRDHPMMVCWGGRDFCFNDHFYELWEGRFPKADFHYFEDAGHYVVEDAHENILPLIRRFMQNESGRP